LGVLLSEGAPWSEGVSSVLRPYHANPLLERLERNRLALYLKLLELNDALQGTKHDLEVCRFETEEVVEQLRAELLSTKEALALSMTARSDPGPQEDLPDEKPSSPSASARRSLAYDLHRAQIKVKRVGDRLKGLSR
jgi:hypothetical protein